MYFQNVLGEVSEACLWGILFLVQLQSHSLLLNWEMSPLGGIFRENAPKRAFYIYNYNAIILKTLPMFLKL